MRERLAQHRTESDVQQLSFGDRSARIFAGEFRRHRRLAHDRRSGQAGGRERHHGERRRRSTGFRDCGRCCWRSPEQFPRTVTEKLMAYALGRRLEYYDQPSVRKIVRDAAAHHYRWSSLILGIVESPTFPDGSAAGAPELSPAKSEGISEGDEIDDFPYCEIVAAADHAARNGSDDRTAVSGGHASVARPRLP